jgi:hypothetical protein
MTTFVFEAHSGGCPLFLHVVWMHKNYIYLGHKHCLGNKIQCGIIRVAKCDAVDGAEWKLFVFKVHYRGRPFFLHGVWMHKNNIYLGYKHCLGNKIHSGIIKVAKCDAVDGFE